MMKLSSDTFGRIWYSHPNHKQHYQCDCVAIGHSTRESIMVHASKSSVMTDGTHGVIEVFSRQQSMGFAAVEVSQVETGRGANWARCNVGGLYDTLFDSPLLSATYENRGLVWPATFDAIRLGLVSGALTISQEKRLVVCRDCRELPTFSVGCSACGSSDIGKETLLHHFRCAAVLPKHEFHTRDSINCPKCYARNLVVGVDFEVLSGRQACNACGHQMDEQEVFGNCTACRKIFPMTAGRTVRVPTYRVHQLHRKKILPTRRLDASCGITGVATSPTFRLQSQR